MGTGGGSDVGRLACCFKWLVSIIKKPIKQNNTKTTQK
jgi:hypothetical protein